jgi:uncharacterized RDD family membrane protein YckC
MVPPTLIRLIESAVTTLVPMFVWALVAPWLLGTILPIDAYLRNYSKQAVDAITVAIIALPIIMWFILDSSVNRASYGMRRRHIRYATLQGEQPSFGHYLLRDKTAMLLLPILPISLLMVVSDPHRRSLADRVCKTRKVSS